MPTPSAPRPTTAARLEAAIQPLGWQKHLAALLACQGMPSAANTCQSTPPRARAQNEPTAPAPGTKTCQTLPTTANARHEALLRKTNPPASTAVSTNRKRSASPLSPNQLRAARLLLAGHSTKEIAAALGINRHTLGAWKRLPLFQQELRHLLTTPANTLPSGDSGEQDRAV